MPDLNYSDSGAVFTKFLILPLIGLNVFPVDTLTGEGGGLLS